MLTIKRQVMINNAITDNIAATLFIPMVMKKRESNRKNPYFNDPYTCKLIEKIDYDFSKFDKAVRSSVGVAIRAKYFDQLTAGFIMKKNNPVIVHIGCGLDPRFQRIGAEVYDKVVFYDLDLPEVIELRKKLLPESGNNIYISSSMLETGWMDSLKSKHPESAFLFVIEGVLMYFEKDDVKSLFKNIAARFKDSKMIFDVANSWMCKNSYRHDSVKLTNASLKWGCDNDREPETWAQNLKLESSRLFNSFTHWKKVGMISRIIMRMVPAIKTSFRLLTYTIS